MKTKLGIVTVAVALAFSLTACSGDEEPKEKDPYAGLSAAEKKAFQEKMNGAEQTEPNTTPKAPSKSKAEQKVEDVMMAYIMNQHLKSEVQSLEKFGVDNLNKKTIKQFPKLVNFLEINSVSEEDAIEYLKNVKRR